MKNEKIFLLHRGITSFAFSMVFTVSSIYYIERIGLNPFQLVIVGTVLELAYFIFEIPTGVVADIYSRKLSIIIGLLLTGFGFILEGLLPFFFAVLASQISWGIGATFLSGAVEAWITDEVGTDKIQNLFLTGAQVSQFAAFFGVIISVILGYASLNIPIYIGGIIFIILSIYHIAFMRESNFRPLQSNESNTFNDLFITFNKGIKVIRNNKVLLSAILITLFYGLYSEGIDRLWNVHFLKDIYLPEIYGMKPVVLFGIINTGSMLIMIFVTSRIKKTLLRNKSRNNIDILIVINTLLVTSIVCFGLSKGFYTAVIAIWSVKVLRNINRPLFSVLVNKQIETNLRATVLSTISQFDSLGQVIGGPILGYIALRVSIVAAILAAGVILIPVVALLILLRGDNNDRNLRSSSSSRTAE